jgi:hypothetical protein
MYLSPRGIYNIINQCACYDNGSCLAVLDAECVAASKQQSEDDLLVNRPYFQTPTLGPIRCLACAKLLHEL